VNKDLGPFPALVMVAGSALLITGIWKIYHPAALIFAGTLLMALAFFGRRGAL
jgi:hypothetical protein